MCQAQFVISSNPHNNPVGEDYWTYSTDEEAEAQEGHK